MSGCRLAKTNLMRLSFAYNEGTHVLKSSTLLKKLNEMDYRGAADQLLVWDKITDPHTGRKIVSDTLKKRRLEERSLFLS